MSGFFKLRPSLIFSSLLLFGYSLALLIVFTLPVVVFGKIALAVFLVCALVYYLRRDAWLSASQSPVAIKIEGNEITLLTRGGTELLGQISGSSVVTPVITVLKIFSAAQKASLHIVIFPDSMDKEQFSKLRVLLKWGSKFQ